MEGRRLCVSRQRWSMLVLSLMLMVRLHGSWARRPVYPDVFVSTFIDTLYDDSGLEVTEDQLLEMSAMRSTTLGFGLGLNYTFPPDPLPSDLPTRSLPQFSSSFSSPSSPSSSSSSSSSSPSRRHRMPHSFSQSRTSTGFPVPVHAFRRFKRQARFNRANSIGDNVFNSYTINDVNNDNGFNSLGVEVFSGYPYNVNNNNNNNYGSSSLGEQVFNTYTGSNSNNNNNNIGNNRFGANSLGPQIFNAQANNFNNNNDNDHNFEGKVFQDSTQKDFTTSGAPGHNRFSQGSTFGQFPHVTFEGFAREDKGCAPEKQLRCDPRAPYRSIDGSCNNLAQPRWGAINQRMRRLLPAVYFDGYDVPRLTSTSNPRRLLPCARLVSRHVHEPVSPEGRLLPGRTNLLQVWGQFLAHDITGTPAHKAPNGRDLKCCEGVYLTQSQQIHRDAFDGGRCNPIYIPPADRHFTYSCMNFARSIAARRKKDCDSNSPREVRQQLNMLTAWVDASQVYGSTSTKAGQLRVYQRGLLKVTENNLLPEDTNSTCVKEEPGDYCFLAGEKRANEHAALMALHIVFHRYHNDMALKLAGLNPGWTDERIYQEARRVIGAIMQHVIYHDWLPAILGPDVMREYSLNVLSAGSSGPSVWRYNSKLDPTILNAFATAAFRFGHTMVPSRFTMGGVQVRLFTMFNRPKFILQNRGEGLRMMCSGMVHDPAQPSSRLMARDLSDQLFEDRHNVSMDLASLNIHRARDHGLPPYLRYRGLCGLPVYSTFEEMYRAEPDRTQTLRQVYDDVGDVDLFTGSLTEKTLPGAVVGPTFACLLARQFHSLKFADRFWYESRDGPAAFSPQQLREIRKVTLSKVMCRTAQLRKVTANPLYQEGVPLPRPVLLPSGRYVTRNRYMPCEDLPEIDFRHWYDPNAQT